LDNQSLSIFTREKKFFIIHFDKFIYVTRA